jgi:hypothetical protein
MLPSVVIIGAGRSGTKFLRDVLAADEQFMTVPYDVNYIWRQGCEDAPDDEIAADSYSEALGGKIRRDLVQQAKRPAGAQGAGVLLEKTVSNALRVGFVQRVLPDAKYIHLVRDGRDVVESAYRCWTAPVDFRYLWRKARTFPFSNWRYGAKYIGNRLMGTRGTSGQRLSSWGPRYRGIEQDLRTLPLEAVVARQWVRCESAALEAVAKLPPKQVYEVRYEDFVQSSDAVRSLVQFLGLSGENGAITRRFRETLAPPAASRWAQSFSPEQRSRIAAEIEGLQTHLGYGRAL